MQRLLVVLASSVVAWFLTNQFLAPAGPDLTFKGNEVLLATGDIDLRFSKGGSFEETYMLFGGGYLDHRNAIAKVTLAGLSARHAKPIFSRYPDFHKCASPGAALAKDKVVQLDMVPANGWILSVLKESLEEFNDRMRSGGERVCVRLRGSHLRLKSAEIREIGENITDTFRMTDFQLIDSASRVECESILRGA